MTAASLRYLPLNQQTSLVRIDVDPGNVLKREFTELELKNLPFAARMAANATGFAVRERWKDKAGSVFDRPTELTKRAALIQKATKEKPYATVFLRSESASVPPAKYLMAQVLGGVRAHKGFERRLIAAGILPAGQFAVPGKGEVLDAFGNMRGSRLNQVLSQLRARFDPKQNETATSRARRQRREARSRQRRGDVFAVIPGRGNHLPPGVYQRVSTGFGGAIKSVLAFVKPPRYQVRYDIFSFAQGVYTQQFPFHFENELAKAVQTSKYRGQA